jgi:hypothetical protein
MRSRICSSSIITTAIAAFLGYTEAMSAAPGMSLLHSTFEQQTTQGQTRFYWSGGGAGIVLEPGGNIRIQSTAASSLIMRFPGANACSTPQGEVSGMVPVRYYTESSPEGVERPHFGRVRYRDLYPGIDLIFHVDRGSLEFDLELAPGADPDLIRMHYETASARLIPNGEIRAQSGDLTVFQKPPVVHQVVNGTVVPIATHYVLRDTGAFGVRLDRYNPALPLTIDPVLTISSVVGGQGYDVAYAMGVDASGSIYVAGETDSLTFWGTGRRSNRDAFVMKLNSTGSTILYATYLGGSGLDSARGIAVDSAGNAYIVGTTNSTNFPATSGAVGKSNAGFEDAFVFKLSSNGSIVYSTMVGSSGSDLGLGIAADGSGNAYITGQTTGSFPVTTSAFQTTYRGNTNCYVAKLNATASALVYSTYLGGSSQNICRGIAVDASGNAYLAGVTYSTDFPIQGGVQSALRGSADAFVAKLNPAGSALVYSTFLGGDGFDEANAITVDPSGAAYVAGDTGSWNFPVTSGAYQSANKGGYDAFVVKLAPAGNVLNFATLLGGNYADAAYAVAVDSAGRTFIAGHSNSFDLPVQQAAQGSIGGMFDGFTAAFDPTGSTLLYSSYIGGSGDDHAYAIAATAGKKVYAAGSTQSQNFPGATRTTTYGDTDLFVVEVVGTWPDLPVSVSVNPSSITLLANQTQQFTATVSNTTNTAVTWSISPSVGTISTTGFYTAPSTIGGTQPVTVTAVSQSDGVSAGTAAITLSSGASGTTVQFVKLDTTTQGSWKGVYGSDGYNVVDNAVSYPSYVTPMVSGALDWVWAATTTDVRALQQASGTQRIATTWYTFDTMIIDLPFVGSQVRQVAVYSVDWDVLGRGEKAEILDVNNNVLDSRSATSLTGGVWFIWKISGHVRLRVTRTAGLTAIVGGLFFDTPGTQTTPTAQFVALDTTTQGSWKGLYGTDGYNIIDGSNNYPGYVTPTASGALDYVWEPNTTDARGLQQGGTSIQRIASAWYTFDTMTIDLPFTDSQSHQFAMYSVDWDRLGRGERVEMLDVNNNVLDTQTVTNFTNGVWLVWKVTGHVRLRVTRTAGLTAVISGLFFSTAAQVAPTAQFVKLDTATQGSWKGVYGTTGYNIIDNAISYPSFVLPTATGALDYVWQSGVPDVRGLQQAGASTQRIASAWYTFDTMTIDLPFIDSQTHQFAMYALDWDLLGRGQRIDILDVNNNVLDSRTLTNFTGGVWLVWNVGGHVRVRLTKTAGLTAVVSGLFF